MSASLAGALKARIESLGLGLVAYRDDAGTNATASKWVTIQEAIAVTPVQLGDDGDVDTITELVQVDLWQPWRANEAGGAAEDYDLADQIVDGLHGCQLTAPPKTVRSVRVDQVVRLLEREQNLVHHAITVRVQRDR